MVIQGDNLFKNQEGLDEKVVSYETFLSCKEEFERHKESNEIRLLADALYLDGMPMEVLPPSAYQELQKEYLRLKDIINP